MLAFLSIKEFGTSRVKNTIKEGEDLGKSSIKMTKLKDPLYKACFVMKILEKKKSF